MGRLEVEAVTNGLPDSVYVSVSDANGLGVPGLDDEGLLRAGAFRVVSHWIQLVDVDQLPGAADEASMC